MGGQSMNGLERGFFLLGKTVGRFWYACLAATLAVYVALALGLWDGAIEDDFFGYQVIKPRSRLQRETNYYESRVDEGYVGGSETVLAVSTESGKNVLNRKNLMQAADFLDAQNMVDIGISYRDTTITGREVLLLQPPTPQPFRFTVLDCWQEGSFDFDGTIVTINPDAQQPLDVIVYTVEPFYTSEIPAVTPYNYCLFARVGLLFAPIPDADPSLFGRCRQFINLDAEERNQGLADAYDFYRFYLYDMAKSTSSFNVAWGCRAPFADEPPGRCDLELTCCQVAQLNQECALCNGGNNIGGSNNCTAACSNSNSDWNANDRYDANYSNFDACNAFGFYPVSPPFAAAIGTTPTRPTEPLPLDSSYADCAERRAAYEAADPAQTTELVRLAMEEVICDFGGTGASTCPRGLVQADFDWRFGPLIASDAELKFWGLSSQCAMWDGGPEGLDIFPYVGREQVLGKIDLDNGEADVELHLYLSRGWKAMCDRLRDETGQVIGTQDCKKGREEWLRKFSAEVHGRAKESTGDSLHFGTMTSKSIEYSWEQQTVPEQTILIVGYVLVLAYAALTSAAKAPASSNAGSLRSRLGLASVAVLGVLVVFAGLAAGWGLSAGYLNIKLNVSIIQVLPFLLVGLGVNDLFLIISAYVQVIFLGKAGLASHVVVGEVLAEVGPAISLTTVANVCAFLVGRYFEMRLIRDFSTVAAICSATIFFGLLFGFSSVLAVHAAFCAPPPLETPQQPTADDDDDDDRGDEHQKKKKKIEMVDRPTETRQKASGAGSSASSPSPSQPSQPSVHFSMRVYSRHLSRVQSSLRDSLDGYAALISKPMVHYSILVATVATLIPMCVVYFPALKRQMGLPLNSLFIPGTSEFYGAKYIEMLKTEPSYFMHKAFDVPHYHPYYAPLTVGDYSLMQTYADAKKVEAFSVTWYHVMVGWGAPCAHSSFEGANENDFNAQDCADSDWYRSELTFNARCGSGDPFSNGNCGPVVTASKTFRADEHALASLKPTLPFNFTNDGIPVCTTWPVWMFTCDNGTRPCFEGYLHDADVAPTRDPALVGFHPDYFYECLDLWLNNDEQWSLLTPLFLCEDPANRGDDGDFLRTFPIDIKMCDAVAAGERRMYRGKYGDGHMEFSQVLVFVRGVGSQAAPWITYMESAFPKLRRFESEVGIYGFPGTDNQKFFTQFRWLWKRLWATVGIAAAVIFAILFATFALHAASVVKGSLRFAVSLWCALIILVSIFVSLLLTITVFAAVRYKLNCFSAVNVIMIVGFGVEFTTHLVFVYLHYKPASGGLASTNAARLAHAMKVMLPPILDGSLSTLLSILPLSASKFPYVVDYFFGLYAIISCFGIFVGVVVLPCLLAAVGPFNFIALDNNNNVEDKDNHPDDDEEDVQQTPTVAVVVEKAIPVDDAPEEKTTDDLNTDT
eukprot:CAMPEP_0118910582 /NCGR_PEP_ID=MMETSP1166-20130328/12657_1 /TAXON_ID=1104430 /ORGANISM="Chrysoreinhardia sp, Strain CCMP3193" /LENGTH=1419 /DNA_ID=CAMNT_0006850049 /DNA_START=89 /DNA_END=4348 /DNA_ORIENTATION=+